MQGTVLAIGLTGLLSLTAEPDVGKKTRVLREYAGAMQQTSGKWRVDQGILRPTDLSSAEDYCTDVGAIFFTKSVWRDVTLTCEFLIPKGSTGAGGPSVYFRCTGPGDYSVVHFINYWNSAVLMRARPGEFETQVAHHMGAPLKLDTWQRLKIECDGDRTRIHLDRKCITEATDSPCAGVIGLGARVREVRYRDVCVQGAPAAVKQQWQALPPVRSHSVVCRDSGIGAYEAFPAITRLKNGHLVTVFYSGWTHVSRPGGDRPRGGRICMVRSTDNGRTWSQPQVVGDTPFDDRDPSVWQAKDGRIWCAWPAADWPKYAARQYDAWCHAFRTRSTDNGVTWSEPEEWRVGKTLDWTVWTAPRLLCDGTWLMPVYRNRGYVSAATVRSVDDGKTWSRPAYLDETNKSTDEPDIVELPGRRLLCVMRPGKELHAWQSWSNDLGRTWTPPRPLDWHAHAPNLLLTSDGVLLCAHRDPGTSIHYSFDHGRTWAGMVMIDSCGGAYPGMVELPDGRVLIVYYTEGRQSDIRAQFLDVSRRGVRPAPN